MSDAEKITRGEFSQNVETIIAGSTETRVVERAVEGYKAGLKDFLTINNPFAEYLGIDRDDAMLLEQTTGEQVEYAAQYTQKVVLELNERNHDRTSKRYTELKRKDKELWNKKGYIVESGVMVCVDQGVVTEIYPPDTLMGRSLAGTTPKRYIRSANEFIMDPTFMKKMLIHEQRQNPPDARMEWGVVHTGCGRVGQMLSNTHNPNGYIPKFDQYFEHANALFSEFTGDPDEIRSKLVTLMSYWNDHRPDTGKFPISDEGRLAAILQKVAKQQALRREIKQVPTEMPIMLVDKRDLNIFTGLDNIDVLTDKEVLQAGGYTDEILEKFGNEGRIFSLRHKASEMYALLEQGSIKKGSRSYKDLQEQWIIVQEELVEITSNLWTIFESNDPQSEPLKKTVEQYLRSVGTTNHIPVSKEIRDTMQRRLIHDMFHITAYTYLLNTFENGNDPGNHMEGHLETGNPDEGAKKFLGLGQGELDQVNTLNILTEYAVLLHSTPGQTGAPVPALLRLDTDRPSNERMSAEETGYAQNVFNECLKLWPYMIAGDIIPFLVVRGKKEGGISRLPLSVLKTFDNLGICFERGNLPDFAPAVNPSGEVVLVPSRQIVQTRLACLKQGGGLIEFRKELSNLAEGYSSKEIQQAFQREYKQNGK